MTLTPACSRFSSRVLIFSSIIASALFAPAAVAGESPRSVGLEALSEGLARVPALAGLELDALTHEESEDLYHGEVDLGGESARVAVFWPGGRASAPVLLLALPELSLPALVPALDHPPFDAFALDDALLALAAVAGRVELVASELPSGVREIFEPTTKRWQLRSGVNLVGLVETPADEAGGALARLGLAALEDLKLELRLGVKDGDAALTRQGSWREPFGVKDVSIEAPTIHLGWDAPDDVTGGASADVLNLDFSAWGSTKIDEAEALFYAQGQFGGDGPELNALGFDAPELTLDDLFSLERALAANLGIEEIELPHLPLEAVTLVNEAWQGWERADGARLELRRMMLVGVTSGGSLPGGVPFLDEGPALYAHGALRLLGQQLGDAEVEIDRRGARIDAAIELESLGPLGLGDARLKLGPKDERHPYGDYELAIEARAEIMGQSVEGVRVVLGESSMSFAIEPACPAQPLRITGHKAGPLSLEPADFDVSFALDDCLAELAHALVEDAEETIAFVEELSGEAIDTAEEGLDELAGEIPGARQAWKAAWAGALEVEIEASRALQDAEQAVQSIEHALSDVEHEIEHLAHEIKHLLKQAWDLVRGKVHKKKREKHHKEAHRAALHHRHAHAKHTLERARHAEADVVSPYFAVTDARLELSGKLRAKAVHEAVRDAAAEASDLWKTAEGRKQMLAHVDVEALATALLAPAPAGAEGASTEGGLGSIRTLGALQASGKTIDTALGSPAALRAQFASLAHAAHLDAAREKARGEDVPAVPVNKPLLFANRGGNRCLGVEVSHAFNMTIGVVRWVPCDADPKSGVRPAFLVGSSGRIYTYLEDELTCLTALDGGYVGLVSCNGLAEQLFFFDASEGVLRPTAKRIISWNDIRKAAEGKADDGDAACLIRGPKHDRHGGPVLWARCSDQDERQKAWTAEVDPAFSSLLARAEDLLASARKKYRKKASEHAGH